MRARPRRTPARHPTEPLVFALRRLVADQVLVLLAVRDDAVAELPASLRRIVSGHHGDVVRVPGLDEHELRELARALGITSLPAPAARRLRDGTQGNPLHVRAVLDEVPGGWQTARQPLPSPRSFRLLVGDRYAACVDGTRALLDAAAVLGVRCPLPLVAAVGEVAEPVQAVDEAVARGLLLAETGRHPWTLAFPHPLVVGVGRSEEADELLRVHEERAAERGRASSVARLARARGRVEVACGRPQRAAAAFEKALDAAGRVALPFERAKVELAAGAFLRRAGHRRRAAELLTAAFGTFERLGARPYAERCRVELAGSGLRPAPEDGPGALLTSQELVVARLAAAGRTNREIAADLVVSVKTVEYHLRNAFHKLGASRRGQLAALLT